MLPRLLAVVFVALAAQAGEAAKPVAEGAEGKRAFDDLAAYYGNHQAPPPYKQALADLTSSDAAKAKSAGAYLLALFRQLFADESNGRAPWQRTPFFGGGSVCDAREFRRALAEAFGKEAQGEAALDAVLWLNAGKTRDQLPDERPKREAGGWRIDAP